MRWLSLLLAPDLLFRWLLWRLPLPFRARIWRPSKPVISAKIALYLFHILIGAAAVAALPRRAEALLGGLLPVAASGGYNNLTNWPSIGKNSDSPNRPQFNSGTNVLSWIGPIGGGASTTSDSSQTLTLTNSAITTTTSNGQTISGLNIGNSFSIAHTGVTLKNCVITCSSGGFAAIAVTNTSGPTIIEDCLIQGFTPTSHGGAGSFQGIAGNLSGSGSIDNATIYRCTFQNFSNAIAQGMNSSSVYDCLFWDWCDGDDDYIELDGSTNTVLIQHNAFDAQQGPDAPGASGYDSSSNPNNFFGSTNAVTITNNLTLNATSIHAWLFDGSQAPTGTVTGSFTNNAFYNSTNYGAINNVNSNVTVSPNSGNFIATTPTSTSGSLINGTGVL